MPLKIFVSLLILSALYSCSWNKQPVNQQQAEIVLPSREESVGFLSLIHRKLRDAEQASYDLMYGIRDEADSFVFDVQKDYYNDFKK